MVYAEGPVAFGGKEKGTINMEVYGKLLDRLKKNKRIKAVVLRVNSPGGSSFTSDNFWKRIEDLKEAGKYVVASFGDYAASGGYYISAGADQIVSESTTLTGSIGAYSMMPDFYEASKDHLGINWDTIGTGKRTFIYSAFTPRSDSDNALLQAETERTYREFISVVAKGRGLTEEEVDEIGQGRVWSGSDALEIGLVDSIGTLQEAISIAALGAELDDYKVLEYPIIKKNFWEQLLDQVAAGTQINMSIADSSMKIFSQHFKESLDQIEAACSEPQFRIPFHIPIQ